MACDLRVANERESERERKRERERERDMHTLQMVFISSLLF